MTAEGKEGLTQRFFAGLTEHAFCQRLGVADPHLVDYVSQLLVRFLRADDIYPIRGPRGQRLMQVADMLAEAEKRQGPARRYVHRQIGDFTLFWMGVYPEVADRMRKSGVKDAMSTTVSLANGLTTLRARFQSQKSRRRAACCSD